MVRAVTEFFVDDAALPWLESLGDTVKYGPEIGPGELFAERENYMASHPAERGRQPMQKMQQFKS
jgi:type I restriction enzyme, R subunit